MTQDQLINLFPVFSNKMVQMASYVTHLWWIKLSTFLIKNLNMYAVDMVSLEHPASSRSNRELCITAIIIIAYVCTKTNNEWNTRY